MCCAPYSRCMWVVLRRKRRCQVEFWSWTTMPPIATCLRAGSREKRLRDRERKFIQDLEQERQRSESLLLNILPQIVVDRMRDGEKVIADRIIDATILFCDLVGFTALSQELSADRTIELLSR